MSIIDNQLRSKAQLVNAALQQLIGQPGRVSEQLKEAFSYTLEAGGKRVRAAVVLLCCEVVSGRANNNAQIAAAAIELVHTYSLVHDDLPAMDDDDFRRGKLTCHKAFDEATAILAGDGLLTLAFEILAKEVSEPAIAIELISRLAEAAGPAGMLAGQMADMKSQKSVRNPVGDALRQDSQGEVRSRKSSDFVEYIHLNKTAKMFQAAAAMGAVCGRASQSRIESLSEYGLKIGLSFQIADDILDVEAGSEQLGKTAGKDAKAGKMTYPALVGIEKSRQLEKQLADEAIAALQPFSAKADTLRQLATALLQRTK